ncbi:protein HEAT INTOLERANT 4-like, partial [Telopea speciosissima]|uniref:protein HEAT INTOLERANT 4-like n=1 Tax=Telopea speciosissima TaxID=54955 RepID=UPI001CC699C5
MQELMDQNSKLSLSLSLSLLCVIIIICLETMGRGSKRKASQKEEIKSPEELPKESASSRVKRVKAPVARKPESEPEYFPDKHNLEDLWQAAFPVGTEWDQLDSVYQFKWDFSHLEKLLEYNGELHGKKVYLFGCTEFQTVKFKGEDKIICIPAVVAVVSPFPPSDKIGITSVQRETEEIIPMKQMKMDWVPYIPLKDRDNQVERMKLQIYILSCTQRRAALRNLKLEHIMKYQYCLPYFYQPLKEDELEQSTIVDILYPSEPEPVVCDFDWKFDELEEFTDDLIKEQKLSEDQKDAFKEFVKEKVREAAKANQEASEARKKVLEEMSEETKAAFETMRFYKFYPVQTPDTPDVSKVKASFINRYYGKAHYIVDDDGYPRDSD